MTEPLVQAHAPLEDEGVREQSNADSPLHRYNTVLTIAAACVTPILYLFYIDRYAVNALQLDDWYDAVLVHQARSGHFSWAQLWAQYNEARVFLTNLIFVLFGWIDRLNITSILFFDAALFILSYVMVLLLFQRYLRKPLTPIPVLLVGVTWFSLADVQDALWDVLSWYLVLIFFTLMLCVLLMPSRRRWLWFTVAILAAVAASLSIIQGFLLWPVGVICLLWGRPWARRAFYELGIWLGAAVITAALYLPGYSFSQNGCPANNTARCTALVALENPLKAFRYLIILIGNVVPGGYEGGRVRSFDRFELLGFVILGVAIFIVAQSWRYRASREQFPLPLLLIVFSLLYDLQIALARSGRGYEDVFSNNRYVMPNLVLLTGIIMYAWAHRPPFRLPADRRLRSRAQWSQLGFCLLVALVVLQVVVATGFGIRNGEDLRKQVINEARLAVNLDRVPSDVRTCDMWAILWGTTHSAHAFFSSQTIRNAAEDQLAEFQPGPDRIYRDLGPPPVSPLCTTHGASSS